MSFTFKRLSSSLLISIVNGLYNFQWMGWVELVSDGASRDILVLWDRRVELVEHYVGNFLVACHFKSVDDGIEWGFARVHGLIVDSHRHRVFTSHTKS